ncbi:MAG TPA: metallophosphoesterase [Gemmatimonadaceae bacterium]|jgi:Icc-related predicted phosphoesterase|nr:metallophosphoesterase [Gemmatimonadaceae bacterium]
MPTSDTVRIAAVSDVHYGKHSQGALQPLFTQIAERADVLLIPGDLTDYGLAEEARLLARDLTAAVKIPIVAVLGNHDYESDQSQDIADILTDAGVHVLDGDAVEVHGIGFAGVKGFAGGFGRGTLGPWGERAIKQFVQEAVNEALKLESALARLKNATRIALLHYSPIRATVEGEPAEIFPWLGSSRLEEPLTRFQVSAVVHGHAHKGSPEGKTATGIPVYNVSLPVLRAAYPDQPAFRIIEVPRPAITAESEDRRAFGRRATDREPPASRVADAPAS